MEHIPGVTSAEWIIIFCQKKNGEKNKHKPIKHEFGGRLQKFFAKNTNTNRRMKRHV